MSSFSTKSAIGLSAIAAFLVFGACSGTESGDNAFGDKAGSGGGGGGGSGGAQTGGSGGSEDGSAASTGGGVFVDGGLTGDGSLNADSACAATVVEAEVLPLDLYIMADRSGSMDNYETPSRWQNLSAALNAFFGDPQSAGLFVALRFFPLNDNCGPMDGACSGNAYATPLVPFGDLPGNQGPLANAISSTTPDGCFTPTQEALNGVLKGALQRQLAEPLHVVSAVIVSDGEPCCGDCPGEDAGTIGAIAQGYANPQPGTPAIKTFAIYVADVASDVMTAIAHQGGTGSAYDATAGQQSFIDALNAIRGSMLACEYKMPEADAGNVNPELIQVAYTPGGATEGAPLVRYMDKSSCGTAGDGWYYDNNDTPTKIVMCDDTCDKLQNDEHGRVDILVGCSGVQR